MKKILLSILIIFSLSLNAQTLSSLFSDHKSFSVGDVLTVIISEKSSASASATNETSKSFGHSASSTQGTGPLDFIPLSGMSLQGSGSSTGDAKTSRGGSISSKITVTIESIDQNGNMKIVGSKSVKINGENEITTLEGIIRPQDVGADNTIYSSNIANAKIEYKGKGAVNEGSRTGIISRILNFIF